MSFKKMAVNVLMLSLLFSINSYASSEQKSMAINAPESLAIKASTKGWSMLEIPGKKIKFADTSNGECEINAKRSLALGKLVFKPASEKGFILFVTDTNNETYPVEVKPSDKVKPGLIKLRDLVEEAQNEILKSNRIKQLKSSVKVVGLAESRTAAITDLMKAMVLGDTPRNADVAERNEVVYFWNEANIIHKKRYTVGVLDGDAYQLTNISNTDMVLEEKEFYSLGKNVSAVSLSSNTIKPNQTINVYVVRAARN